MKKVNYKKWAEDLRSGKYKQGKNILCINDKYCCLGVLAKTQYSEFWNGEQLNIEEQRGSKFFLRLYNLRDDDASWLILPNTLQQNLSIINDAGYTFTDIAEMISNRRIRNKLNNKVLPRSEIREMLKAHKYFKDKL